MTINPADRAPFRFRERRAQNYEAAYRALARSRPQNTDAAYLTERTVNFIAGLPNATAEAALGMLLSLAVRGMEAEPPFSAASREALTSVEPEKTRQVMETALRLSEREIRKRKTALLHAPGDPAAQTAYEAAICPPSVSLIAGAATETSWDGRHDGHTVSRSAARYLGLVRYARIETPERRKRAEAAFMAARGDGLFARELWTRRRPVLMIDTLSAMTVKLASDLWLYDDGIGVVLTRKALAADTPYLDALRRFGIPFLFDEKGFIQAFLAADVFPALIEPRLGGFTVTSPTGLTHGEAHRRTEAVPAWVRTMSLIGILNALERSLAAWAHRPKGKDETDARPFMSAATAKSWLARYESVRHVAITSAPAPSEKTAEKTDRARSASLLPPDDRHDPRKLREQTAAVTVFRHGHFAEREADVIALLRTLSEPLRRKDKHPGRKTGVAERHEPECGA